MTLKLKSGVTCPECGGEGFTEGAVEDHGDRTTLCETCWGEGHVPAPWMEMYAMGSSGLCDYCFQPRGAAWDGELFACVGCWEGKHGN